MEMLNFQNILLADDDDDDRWLFKDAIDELKICSQLTMTEDGEKLMQLLNLTDTIPNVLFLDLNMPRKNGIQCLSEIKNSERLKNLPVIIYSTSFQKSAIEHLYKMGAQFYIRKPIGFNELKHVIHEALYFMVELNYLKPSIEKFVISYALSDEYK